MGSQTKLDKIMVYAHRSPHSSLKNGHGPPAPLDRFFKTGSLTGSIEMKPKKRYGDRYERQMEGQGNQNEDVTDMDEPGVRVPRRLAKPVI